MTDRSIRKMLGVLALASAVSTTAMPAWAVDASIDTSVKNQVIHGFGACLYNPAMGDADSLFARTDVRDLYAKDMGFSLLRVSIEPTLLMAAGGNLRGPEVSLGADLAANAAKINWEQARHRYYDDWTRYMVANALEPSRVKIFGSVWSPPHWAKQATGATVQGQATPAILYCDTCDTAGGTWRDGYFQYNARFISAVTRSFQNHTGTPFYALSIQNEASFEMEFNSCNLVPNNDFGRYANALKAVKDEFTANGLTTKIMGPHMANLTTSPGDPYGLWMQTSMINAVKNHSDTTLKNFWQIYTHNYGTGAANRATMYSAYWDGSNNVPGAWASWAGTMGGIKNDGKETWNSEAGGHAATFDGAMDLAHDMHSSLVNAHESAWVYWQFINGGSGPSEHDVVGLGQIANPTASKKYAAMKQFVRYIRPGARQTKATFSNGTPVWGTTGQYDTAGGTLISAYVHDGDARVTAVIVNMRTVADTVSLTVPSSPNVTSFEQYRTSSTEGFAKLSNLSVSSGRISISVPARSIVTVTGVGSSTPPPPPPPTTPPPPPPPSTGGALTRDVWNNITGTAVSAIPTSTTPSSTGTISTFEAPTNVAENYGQRVRGYLTPTTSGSYTFWIASDDDSQLWLGTSDQASSRQQIASVTGWTGSREWGKYTSQKSTARSLTAGTRYYIEALMKEGGGGDNLAVAWRNNNSTTPANGDGSFIISGTVLTAWDGGSTPPPPPPPPSGGTGNGLRGEYFHNRTFTGTPVLTRTDATVNFAWSGSPGTGVNADQFAVRWTGQVEAPSTGTYTFQTVSDDGIRLSVNGSQIINNWTDHGPTTNNSAGVSLTGGTKYNLTLEFYEATGGAEARLRWITPGTTSAVTIPQGRLYAAGSTTPPPPPPPPSSLFTNPGFESDLTGWTNTGGSVIITGADVASGTKAVRTGTAQGGVEQTVNYTTGGTLNVNVKAKIDTGVSGWSGIGIDFLDSANVEVGEVSFQVTGSTYQTWSNTSVAVPAGTAKLRFWSWKPGTTGNLFVDDVNVLKN